MAFRRTHPPTISHDCSTDSSPPGRFPFPPMIVDAHTGGQIENEKAWIAPLLAEAIVHPL